LEQLLAAPTASSEAVPPSTTLSARTE